MTAPKRKGKSLEGRGAFWRREGASLEKERAALDRVRGTIRGTVVERIRGWAFSVPYSDTTTPCAVQGQNRLWMNVNSTVWYLRRTSRKKQIFFLK